MGERAARTPCALRAVILPACGALVRRAGGVPVVTLVDSLNLRLQAGIPPGCVFLLGLVPVVSLC